MKIETPRYKNRSVSALMGLAAGPDGDFYRTHVMQVAFPNSSATAKVPLLALYSAHPMFALLAMAVSERNMLSLEGDALMRRRLLDMTNDFHPLLRTDPAWSAPLGSTAKELLGEASLDAILGAVKLAKSALSQVEPMYAGLRNERSEASMRADETANGDANDPRFEERSAAYKQAALSVNSVWLHQHSHTLVRANGIFRLEAGHLVQKIEKTKKLKCTAAHRKEKVKRLRALLEGLFFLDSLTVPLSVDKKQNPSARFPLILCGLNWHFRHSIDGAERIVEKGADPVQRAVDFNLQDAILAGVPIAKIPSQRYAAKCAKASAAMHLDNANATRGASPQLEAFEEPLKKVAEYFQARLVMDEAAYEVSMHPPVEAEEVFKPKRPT